MIDFMHQILNGGINKFYSTDYMHTHNILGAADIVISPLSTILIEALCHGKESICLIPKEEDEGQLSQTWKALPCFQEVIKSPGIKTVDYLDDLGRFTKSFKNSKKKETSLKTKVCSLC